MSLTAWMVWPHCRTWLCLRLVNMSSKQTGH